MEGEPDTFEAKEITANNQEKLDQLLAYQKAGYLFHGTKSVIEKLEPRSSRDEDPNRSSGKATAIYATDDWRVPLFMALKDSHDKSLGGYSSGYSAYDDRFEIRGENLDFSSGYIYILPPDTFEDEGLDGGNELISRVPVEPVVVIPVDETMLDLIPNRSFNVRNNEELGEG